MLRLAPAVRTQRHHVQYIRPHLLAQFEHCSLLLGPLPATASTTCSSHVVIPCCTWRKIRTALACPAGPRPDGLTCSSYPPYPSPVGHGLVYEHGTVSLAPYTAVTAYTTTAQQLNLLDHHADATTALLDMMSQAYPAHAVPLSGGALGALVAALPSPPPLRGPSPLATAAAAGSDALATVLYTYQLETVQRMLEREQQRGSDGDAAGSSARRAAAACLSTRTLTWGARCGETTQAACSASPWSALANESRSSSYRRGPPDSRALLGTRACG